MSVPASNKGDAPAKPPQIITTNTLSNIKLPVLQKDDYDTWAIVPKDHLRRFHGMDDAKEIWAAIKTRFGGNANSKKMQKAVLKQQFEAFTISSKESLEKGYDRVFPPPQPPTPGPTEPICGLEVRSWKDDAKEIWAAIKTRFGGNANSKKMQKAVLKQQFEAFTISSKESLEKGIMIGSKTPITVGCPWLLATPTATPGLADEVIHSFLATNADDVDLIHEDLDQIDDLDLEEMDINWQIAMTAIKIKKFYKKTGRRPRVDGKMHVAFDKRKVECFNCHIMGILLECKVYKVQINWVEQNYNSYNALQAKYDELQSEFGNQEAALVAHKIALIDCGMSSTVKIGLGYGIKSNAEVLGYEEREVNVNTGHGNVSSVSSAGTQFKSGASRFNTGKQHVNSGSVHVNSGTQFKSGASRFNTGKQHVNSGSVHVNSGTQFKSGASRFNTGKQHVSSVRVNRPVSNNTSPKPSQVNLNSPKKCFSKQRSPVNRPFSRHTAYKSNIYAVKGKVGTAVKTSAGFPLKHMEHRGIFGSGCSGQ
ncbi:hypothetical protein Tco_0607807 [Tanacetum coccineum]